MLIDYDILEQFAEDHIPEGRHELLYVDSRKSWVESVANLIVLGRIQPKAKTILTLAESWELILFAKHSVLN